MRIKCDDDSQRENGVGYAFGNLRLSLIRNQTLSNGTGDGFGWIDFGSGRGGGSGAGSIEGNCNNVDV